MFGAGNTRILTTTTTTITPGPRDDRDEDCLLQVDIDKTDDDDDGRHVPRGGSRCIGARLLHVETQSRAVSGSRARIFRGLLREFCGGQKQLENTRATSGVLAKH